jgi:hypothetical protein
MEQFYIDRQFGQPIFIDVENGIVLRCYNETEKFTDRMNELYKGNTINFLNEDFIGRAMKGTYHHLRPMVITSALNVLEAVKSRIRNINIQLSDYNVTGDRRKEYEIAHKRLEGEEFDAEKKLKAERERILNEHNFNC